MRRAYCVSTAFGCVLLPAFSHAEDTVTELPATDIQAAGDIESSPYVRSTSSTASKSEVPIRDEAQSVNVVTQQTPDDFQVKSLDDAMKFVSGCRSPTLWAIPRTR